jgi:outer membrane protein TolC
LARRLWLGLLCAALLASGVLVIATGADSADPVPPGTMTMIDAVAWALSRSDFLALVEHQAARARLEEQEAIRSADRIDPEAVTTYEVAMIKYLQPARATSERFLAERRVLATREDLTLQIRIAYLGVLTADRVVQVAAEGVAGAEQHVRVAQSLFKAGMVPRKDILDAEARKAEIETGLAAALKGQAAGRLGLAMLLGLEVDRLPALVQSSATLPAIDPPPGDDRWVRIAQAGRFEAVQMDEMVKLSALNLQLANEYPSGSTSIPWSLVPGDWLPPDWTPPSEEPSWERSERYTIPVARSQHQEALLGRKMRLDELALQVRLANLDIREAEQRVALSAIAAEASQEGLRLSRLRYEAGMATSLEFMAAQVALSQAQTQHVRAGWDLAAARARFIHAISVGSRSSSQPSYGTSTR